MSFCIKRAAYDDPDLKGLVRMLDKELRERNGDEAQDVFDQYNIVQEHYQTVVAYADGIPVGCGCFKEFDAHTIEIKRMYVHKEHRAKGIAAAILRALELWGGESGYTYAVLETGTRLHEALKLYHKAGYSVRAQYGQYIGVEYSVCMEKALTATININN